MKISKYQTLLIKSYPAVDMLPIDLDNPRAIDEAVKAGETGDGLFNFLWNELKDCKTDEEALERIASACRDIDAIREAIENS